MTADHAVAHTHRKQVALVPFPLSEFQGVFGNNSHALSCPISHAPSCRQGSLCKEVYLGYNIATLAITPVLCHIKVLQLRENICWELLTFLAP